MPSSAGNDASPDREGSCAASIVSSKRSLSRRSSRWSESSEEEWAIMPLHDEADFFHHTSLPSVTEEDGIIREKSQPDLVDYNENHKEKTPTHEPAKIAVESVSVDAASLRPPVSPMVTRGPRMHRAYSETHSPNTTRHFNLDIVKRWKRLAHRARSIEDPWIKYRIDELPSEECVRHRYSSFRKVWTTDRVQVKMQCEPFARGAMRECFRVKKLSRFTKEQRWDNAHNYVAKRYFAEVERSTIFEDVRLQMDAKLWAGEYNRHNPPKKVDIAQMYVLEFVNRPDSPLYHLEHYFEGEYIKYNSNSGFVSETARQTPHAFSHFTFERSGHQLIVVDVQGVGDLYTDPQIHTNDGKGYGDGNLGTKGMALFFHTHACNIICKSLELAPFDLSPTERAAQREYIKAQRLASQTVFRGTQSEACVSLPSVEDCDATETLRRRRCSSNMDCALPGEYMSNVHQHAQDHLHAIDSTNSVHAPHEPDCCCFRCVDHTTITTPDQPQFAKEALDVSRVLFVESSVSTDQLRSPPLSTSSHPGAAAIDNEPVDKRSEGRASRKKAVTIHMPLVALETGSCGDDDAFDNDQAHGAQGQLSPFTLSSGNSSPPGSSVGSNSSITQTQDEEREAYFAELRKNTRPSCVNLEQLNKLREQHDSQSSAPGCKTQSILGQIHLDLARYHELCRFVKDEGSTEYDRSAAWFHLDIASKCDVVEAVVTMAQIHLKMDHELLKDFTLEDDEDDDNIDIGVDYMQAAAELGDRAAMLYMAEAYETGDVRRLGGDRQQSFQRAVHWYERSLDALEHQMDTSEEEGDQHQYDSTTESHPRHLILAKLAEIYGSGGPYLSKDPKKAGDLYNEAAEAAMEAMQGKLANKYFMKAEECYGECPDEELSDDDAGLVI